MIKSSVITLYRSLIKEGFKNEAHWIAMLYMTAGYDDDWRHTIDYIAKDKDYPFAAWFPDGKDRVTIGFVREDDDPPSTVLDGLDLLGYFIDNYTEGYAIDNGGRKVKIGRAINKTLDKMKKQLQSTEQESEEFTKLVENISVLETALNDFNNDSARVRSKESNYQIIISQNPHDVARSSYDRNWESCFDIGNRPGDQDAGSNAQTIFCEVANGGMVAYLTDASDNDIENPYARILIRRFLNKDGVSIAMAENSIYGDNIAGFKEKVNQWLQEKNVIVSPGRYRRMGGEYSDTFGEEEFVAPKEEERLLKWLRDDFETPEEEVTWIVYDEDYEILGRRGWWRGSDPFQDRRIFFEDTDFEDSWENYDPDDWESDADGTKKFETESEARQFLSSLRQHGDPEEYMMIKLENEGYDSEDIENMDSNEWQKKFDEYFEARFSIMPHTNNFKYKLKEAAVREISKGNVEYGQETLQLAKEFALEAYRYGGKIRDDLFKNYPNITTKEDYMNISPSLANIIINNEKLSDEKYAELLPVSEKIFINTLNLDNLIEDAFRDRALTAERYEKETPEQKEEYSEDIEYKVGQAMRDAMLVIRGISESQINHLLSFSNKINESKYIMDEANRKLQKDILHHISISEGANMSMLEPLIEKLMKDYSPNSLALRRNSGAITLEDIGWYASKLGAVPGMMNKYLPIFKYQLENLDSILEKEIETEMWKYNQNQRENVANYLKDSKYKITLERLNYVIDSIENGTGRSKKYNWFN